MNAPRSKPTPVPSRAPIAIGRTAPGALLGAAPTTCDSQRHPGGSDPSPLTPNEFTDTNEPPASGAAHSTTATQKGHGGPLSPVPNRATEAAEDPAPEVHFDREAWQRLRLVAEMHHATQKFRVSLGNQLRHAPHLAVMAEAPEKLEADLAKALRQQLRVTAPQGVIDWYKASNGIGEHTLARLLGSIGHPVIAIPAHWEGTGEKRKLITDPPFLRTLRQLWQYAGHGDPAMSRRRRGASAEEVAAAGKPTAKMVLHLMAESAIKQPRRRWTPERRGHWATDVDVVQGSDDSQVRLGDVDPLSPVLIDCATARASAAPESLLDVAQRASDRPYGCGDVDPSSPVPMTASTAKRLVAPETLLDVAQCRYESQMVRGDVDPSSPVPIDVALTNVIPAPETLLDVAQTTFEDHCGRGDVDPSSVPKDAAQTTAAPAPVWRYRAVYETARDAYVSRLHAEPCVRCGPAGRPAPEGSPWSLAHQHNAALRLVGKEILRDLWRACLVDEINKSNNDNKNNEESE